MTLDLARVRALCFDVDGTLSDTDDVYVQRVLRWMPPFLFRDPERAARRMVMWAEAPANALLGLADRYNLDNEMTAVLDWIYRHQGGAPRVFLAVPGVHQMLSRLKGYYSMAIVSTRSELGVKAFLEACELTGFFDVIVTGLSAPHTKPYPDPILLAASEMKVLPHQCVMIGDTTVDIRAGKTAGAQTIGVLCGFGEEPELRQLGADLIVEQTPQVADVLLKRTESQRDHLAPHEHSCQEDIERDPLDEEGRQGQCRGRPCIEGQPAPVRVLLEGAAKRQHTRHQAQPQQHEEGVVEDSMPGAGPGVQQAGIGEKDLAHHGQPSQREQAGARLREESGLESLA